MVINTLAIPGGHFHLNKSWIHIRDFELGRTPVTNEQYGAIANRLGAERFFAMIKNPQTQRKILLARSDDPERLERMNDVEILSSLIEMRINPGLFPFAASFARGGIEVFEVKAHEPPEGFDHPAQPAVTVSWLGAFAFAKLLEMITKQPFALPTDFQWEWALKGGEEAKSLPAKSPVTRESAHYRYDEGIQTTIRVDNERYRPRKNGLRDMIGNVWEWQDTWHGGELPEGTFQDPLGPSEGEFKILRGGSFSDTEEDLVVTLSDYARPLEQSTSIGFRLVKNS